MKRACISIDLDSLYCYQSIFGLEVDESDNIIYDTGLSRFIELLNEFDFKGTLFTVARDIHMADNKDRLIDLVKDGHEIANHTLNHDYRLTRLEDELMEREVLQGKEVLEKNLGCEVKGFRAPGYNMTDRLLNIISKSGHAYDSSVFPCIPYYATKAAVLASMTLTGKQSKSILGDPKVLASPLGPYKPRTDSYWRSGDMDIWEFPISTSPVLRFPFLGSFIIIMGKKFSFIFKMLKLSSDTLVLEFHGMDFMDGPGDGLDERLFKQPDIAVPWEIKLAMFRKLFEALKTEYEVMPIIQCVQELEKEGSGV